MSKPEIIQGSSLIDLTIIDRLSTEKLGKVDQVGIDRQNHRVKGIVLKSGLLNRTSPVALWSQVATIGTDAMLINVPEAGLERVKVSKDEVILNHELWTDAGKKVGKITDFLFSGETGEIVAYLFVSDGWQGKILEGVRQLPPTAIVSIGEERAIAQADAVVKAEPFKPGITHRLSQAKSALQEDLSKTQSHLQNLADKTQQATQGHLQNLAEKTQQVKDKIQDVVADTTQQVKETIEARSSEPPATETSEPPATETNEPNTQTETTAPTSQV